MNIVGLVKLNIHVLIIEKPKNQKYVDEGCYYNSMQFSLRDFFLLVPFFLSFSRRLCTSLRMLTAIRKPPCTTRYMVIISLARQSYRKTAPVFEVKEKQVHEERKNKYMSKLKAFFFQ